MRGHGYRNTACPEFLYRTQEFDAALSQYATWSHRQDHVDCIVLYCQTTELRRTMFNFQYA
jgi:hypothetical protein